MDIFTIILVLVYLQYAVCFIGLKKTITSGTTASAAFREWFSGSSFAIPVSRQGYQEAVWLFYSLLSPSISYDDMMKCELCGESPEIVIGDGVTHSFQKDRNVEIPTVHPLDHLPAVKRVSYHVNRVYIRNKDLGKEIRNFCNRTIGLAVDRYNSMLISLLNCHKESFVELLKYVGYDYVSETNVAAPEKWVKFLYSCGSCSAVLSFLPPSAFLTVWNSVYVAVGDAFGNTTEAIVHLFEEAPVMFSLYENMWDNGERVLPNFLKHVLNGLLHCAYELYLVGTNGSPVVPMDEVPEPSRSKWQTVWNTLEYFPNNPRIYVCRKFMMDKGKDKDEKEYGCRKKASKHNTLLPGTLFFTCPHGVCYGYTVLINRESPAQVYEMLRCRFVKAKIIVYDNACNLQAYAMNRDPAWALTTKFFVDKLHWFNHSGCSYGFNLYLYGIGDGINSQACEQLNKKMRKITTPASFMTAKHFTLYHKVFLFCVNALLKYRLKRVENVFWFDIDRYIKD